MSEQTHKMDLRMQKATAKEQEDAFKLARLCESVCDPGHWVLPRFPDTEEEPGEIFDEDNFDDLKQFYEMVKALCPGLMRVAWGYQVLVDNVCDPEKSYLEYKPELLATAQG